MAETIQGNLCKGLRACGIPKVQALHIVNEVQKWISCSGVEWTNSRIKDLRHWYETSLTGTPVPPEWFKHTKEGYPTGIWNWVFKLPRAKALGVLSLNTVFYEDRLSAKQEEKFLHALAGNGNQQMELLKEYRPPRKVGPHPPREMPSLQFPTVFDMNGSIPIHDGHETVRPNNQLGKALNALRLSWESVPQVTFDFLDRQGLLGYMPMEVLGNEYQLELDRPHDRCVGRVSVLQQPQLKARVVGNPNRITQVTLEPLKQVYMTCARNLLTDVTHDQESGVRWCQDKLRQGIELAGSDLTSASDLLDLDCCLWLVNQVFDFPSITGYADYQNYFREVCRSEWYCPTLNRNVKWEQGDVLGTGPSFGLLTLSNNAAAITAYLCGVRDGQIDPTVQKWTDSFRVVGDDIIMISNLEPYYTRIIESMGGEINHSKTLKSDRVAEFAGRVITPDGSYLKAVKYSEPSDSSFMNYVAQLGDQAKYLLLPKQRQVYDFFKEVPGIVVDGPWSQDSFGIPLGPRYSWYLTEVEPALRAAEPLVPLTDYSMLLLKAELSQSEAGETMSGFDEPLVDEGYLPSEVTPTFKVGGDPRLTNGKTTLDVLYGHMSSGRIRPFETWMRDEEDAIKESETSLTR